MLEPKERANTRWKMENIITFDIEAKDWNKPVALGAYTGEKYTSHNYRCYTGSKCISEFMDWVMKPENRNKRFIAHNGGSYDFGFILEEAIKRDLDFQILTKGNGDFFYLKIEDKHGKPRHFQDSLALMPRGLSTLTDAFLEEDQGKLDFDVQKIDYEKNMDKDEWQEMLDYLKRDCTSLMKVLKEFTSIIWDLSDGKCGCQLTIGSTSMAMYQTNFMHRENTPKIESGWNPDKPFDAETAFRNSYFGGRTEVFRMNGNPNQYGTDELYHYDVNSLFPFCYTEQKLPVGYPRHKGSDNSVLEDDKGGCVKIEARVPEETHIPVLPVRVETEDGSEKVVFPTGEIKGWYMIREVRYAMEVGALTDVNVLDSYVCSLDYPFKKFGEKLYGLKQSIDSEENTGKYNVVKLLLNSFYGKFGMDRNQSKIVRMDIEEQLEHGYRPINDNLESMGVVEQPEVAESKYIIPRIASAITSQARIEMHKWFMKAKDKGGSVWYCDTDSIVTDVELPEGEELGQMDLEGIISESYFLRPKTYAEKYVDGGSLIKAKGMRGIEQDTDFEDFKDAIDGDLSNICSSWNSPRGLKAQFKDDPTNMVKPRDYKRSLKGLDDKRIHSDDGKSSQPLSISDE